MAAVGTQLEKAPEARPKLVAPLWHTGLVLCWLLMPIFAWLPIKHAFPSHKHSDTRFFYILELQLQWIFFAVVYLGLLARDARLRDLIGVRWLTPKDFFRDFGLGFAVSTLDIVVTIALVLMFGAKHSGRDVLDPQGAADLLGWFPIAVTAGFTEEVICRGYLQRQFHAITGNPAVALVMQAAVFSLAHGYDQPVAGMVSKFVFGISMGLLALWRRSLLPGMLGHAWQDCLVGVLLAAY